MTHTKLLAACLLLSACSYSTLQPTYPVDEQSRPYPGDEGSAEQGTESYPQDDTEQTPTRVAVVTPDTVQRTSNRPRHSATENLRAQAASALAAGQSANAERLLDRALRIAPGEPDTYYQLAELKLRLGDAGRALQLARKALTLQPGPELQDKLQRIEADALSRTP